MADLSTLFQGLAGIAETKQRNRLAEEQLKREREAQVQQQILGGRKEGLVPLVNPETKQPELDEFGLIKMQKTPEALESEKLEKRQKKSLIEKSEIEAEKARKSQTGMGKLEAMPQASRQRVDLSAEGLQSLNDMEAALGAGYGTFSAVGDSPYTEAERRFTEAIGRLQSQGAISKNEEARFMKMAPSVLSSEEVKRQKLTTMAEYFRRKMATAGVPEKDMRELGLIRESKIGAKPEGLLQKYGVIKPAAPKEVVPAKTLSDTDQQALQWAKQNPKDPRASAIMQRLGQ